MKAVRIVVCLAVLGFLGSGCEKEYYYGPEDQPVYFEYHYINHAWGVADHGWLIDQEGRMWGFDFPEDYRWPDSTGHMTIEDLEYNLSQADTLLTCLNRKTFMRNIRLIRGAAEGALSESRARGADMGSSILSCYSYDHDRGAYKHVLLAARGDTEQSNLSAEAEKIVDWLKEYGVAFLSD